MDYVGPLGIPHSEFMSWTEEDQDKAIAWNIRKGRRCGKCGTDPDHWVDKDGLPIEPPPYISKTRKCLGCATLHDEREQIDKDSRDTITAFLAKNETGEMPQWPMNRSQQA